jgi:hypothetical protein
VTLQPGPNPTPRDLQERPGGLGVPRHAPRALAPLCPEALAQLPFGGGASGEGAQPEPPLKRAAPQLPPVEFNAVGQTCGMPDWRVMVKNDRSVTGLTPVTSD